MRFSALLIPTLKESPSEARVASHRLMLRAGLIRQLSAGIYTWLPLGLRILRKVERIVREEMDAAGAQEVLLPAVQPAELWQESGRWNKYGKELLRIRDRHEREFCFGPTHEEVIVELVRREVRSYRQLPMNFYQIQTKFRDEIRPRFGVMRGREFLMKDAYSFDMDVESLDRSYKAMFEAYGRIFRGCGLTFRPVEADTGTIGGASSHEFHVLADSGEDVIVSCDTCHYAANLEKAVAASALPHGPVTKAQLPPMVRVATPGQRTIEEVARFMKVSEREMVKSLVMETPEGGVLLLVRGDQTLNEVKARAALDTAWLILTDANRTADLMGAPAGSIGPVGSPLPVLADLQLAHMSSFICGANVPDQHLTGVVWDRDVPRPRFADLRNVTNGEACARCASGTLQLDRGIEVGHVFKLGDTYTRAMNMTVLDADGKARVPLMGCYGIGVSRIVAAAIEQNNDENGILWPMPLAPFHVHLLLVNPKQGDAVEAAEHLEAVLVHQGVEVLVDDRDERLGVKFKDADLLGIPVRIVVGGRSLKEGAVEIQERRGGEAVTSPLDEAPGLVMERLRMLGF